MITKPIRIFLDDSPLQSGHAVRGIGNYTRNLLSVLTKLKDLEMVNLADQPDLVHYPYYDLFYRSLPVRHKIPTVVTIHDVIPLLFPKQYPPGLRGMVNHQFQKIALRNVTAVITDSECSKKDIVNRLNYPSDKIFVTYLAAGKKFHQIAKNPRWADQFRKKFDLPAQFVLYASDINWNKNVIGLVQACKKANIGLAIVGKWSRETDFDHNHPENQIRCQFIDHYWNDPSIKRLGWVDEEDLIGLYNLADLYCQPSYYEGFGLQILEAMACGCPVVSSNISSIPEIANGAAVLVDPYSVDAIAQGIAKIITNTALRNTLIKRGHEQVKKFSWKNTANGTMAVYQSALVPKDHNLLTFPRAT